jgi:putative membrane protein
VPTIKKEKTMHQENLEMWQHPHLFHADKRTVEKRTLLVVAITFLTMILEIVFGWLANSMAALPGDSPGTALAKKEGIVGFKMILILILAILGVVFTAQNVTVVEIRFLFWRLELSRALLILFLLLVGFTSGWLGRGAFSAGRSKRKSG